MRSLRLVLCALLAGCGQSGELATSAGAGAKELPPDLWTRKTGDDWPAFLGPTGDSVSREKGILKEWPKGGPRIVWQQPLGIGYSMPTVSRGRLFVFDRIRNRCRLRCWNAETGESIWEFEYPTDYRDKYDYNGGPRCSPVVDGDRVYAFGPEGMLHCVRAADGKLVWKVDTKAEFGVDPELLRRRQHARRRGRPAPRPGRRQPQGERPGRRSRTSRATAPASSPSTSSRARSSGRSATSWPATRRPSCGPSANAAWRCCSRAAGCSASMSPRGSWISTTPGGRACSRASTRATPSSWATASSSRSATASAAASSELKPGGFEKVWTDEDKPGRRQRLQVPLDDADPRRRVRLRLERPAHRARRSCAASSSPRARSSGREPGLTRSSLLLVDGHFVCLGEDGTAAAAAGQPEEVRRGGERPVAHAGEGRQHDPEGEALLDYPCWAAPILSHGLLYVRGEKRLVCLELIPAKK